MRILREEDPCGVKARKKRRLKRRVYRSRVCEMTIILLDCDFRLLLKVFCFFQGPNYIWHADGHDKLTPYGLAIHGCIDGYAMKNTILNSTHYIIYEVFNIFQIFKKNLMDEGDAGLREARGCFTVT